MAVEDVLMSVRQGSLFCLCRDVRKLLTFLTEFSTGTPLVLIDSKV